MKEESREPEIWKAESRNQKETTGLRDCGTTDPGIYDLRFTNLD
jgi:hypothetical protein